MYITELPLMITTIYLFEKFVSIWELMVLDCDIIK